MRDMRVVIVSRIYQPEPSAASFFLGAVADVLTDGEDDVTVLTARPPRSAGPTSFREDVRTFPVIRDRNGYVRGYLPYLSFDVPLALRLLFVRRPDVVLVEPPPTTGSVVRVVCALRRIPYVYDAADVWSDAADMATDSAVVIRFLRALEAFAMRGATSLVTISQGVKDRVRALGVTREMRVTGFGADTSAFRFLDAPREDLFVYAGSYSSWHGAEIMIDALAVLSDRGLPHRLRVIGNGDRETLATLARTRGVADLVEFLPQLTPNELAAHLASATASLATLRPGTGYEYAFTSKAYSSLAAGCPVVFAGPGPTGPFLEAANLHVRAGASVPYDSELLADALQATADDPATAFERRQLAEWTAAEHSLTGVARRVVDELRSAVTSSGRRR